MKNLINHQAGAISKTELALAYMPNSTPPTALKTLGRWIRKNPDLVRRLATLGYRSTQRLLLPAQVEAIVDALGEP